MNGKVFVIQSDATGRKGAIIFPLRNELMFSGEILDCVEWLRSEFLKEDSKEAATNNQ